MEQKSHTWMLPTLESNNYKERLVKFELFYFGVSEAEEAIWQKDVKL